MDSIIVFRELSKADIRQIVNIMILEVNERLVEYELNLSATDEARDWLAENGYNPEFGARPLRRTVQMEVEDRLSDSLLAGEFKAGDDVMVGVTENQITLTLNEPKVQEPEGEEDEELEAVPLL